MSHYTTVSGGLKHVNVAGCQRSPKFGLNSLTLIGNFPRWSNYWTLGVTIEKVQVRILVGKHNSSGERCWSSSAPGSAT